MSKQTITSGEWYVKVDTSNIFVYNDDQSRQHPIAVFYNDDDGLALANHICDTHNNMPDMIGALKRVIDGHDCYENGEDMSKECPTRTAVIAALRKAGQIE